jgi:hypothetical protein
MLWVTFFLAVNPRKERSATRKTAVSQMADEFHQKTTENPLLHGRFVVNLDSMKRAFVLRLSPDSNPAEGKFQGRVEEVDTNREIKFHSLEDFLAFLQDCLARSSDGG